MKKPETVVLVGASSKPDRYAYKALALLAEYGHQVWPVNPRETEILGHKVYPSLGDIPSGPVDTVTLYVGSDKSTALRSSLSALRPKRVIFNPGAENPDLAETLRGEGIVCLEACTLVLLRTAQF
jgi:predicted CoA-binding protein